MAITLNGAGGVQGDPILAGLGIQLVGAAASMDVTAINDAFIDPVTGFAGTTSVKGSLTPAATVVTAGSVGTYEDTGKQWTLSSTTGLSAGDAIYLSHGTITDGVYQIDVVAGGGTDVTIVGNPLNGSGAQSNIAYQVAWSWVGPTDAVPINHNAAGDQNFFKFDATDGAVNTQQEQDFWVADAPAGSAFVELEGGNFTGQTVSDHDLTLLLVSGWANSGGISHVELANHSGQGVNNFTWTSGGGTGENTLAVAEAGLTAAAGDGARYGRLIFRALSGSANTVGVDFDITVDTTGPIISLTLLAA